MAEIKAPLPESPPPRRPWYRLHLSTWVVLFLTIVILILLIVPGKFEIIRIRRGFLQYSASEGNQPNYFYHHGWPWNYLERYVVDNESSSEDECPGLIFVDGVLPVTK